MKRQQYQMARIKLSGRWMAGAALAALSCMSLSAVAQSGEPDSGNSTATDRGVVVVTQRPLRTFRGDTVRVGNATSRDLSIGVVRPIRDETRRRHVGRSFNGYSYGDRYSRRYVGPHDLSIGVVRPFRQHTPVVRNAPVTVTNPLAREQSPAPAAAASTPAYDTQPVTVGPVFTPRPSAVTPPTSAPDVDSENPWSLFNAGRYRQARQEFGPAQAGDTAEIQTGRALAAALSGDLAAGSEWLPEAPALPVGVTLSDSARQRIELAAEFLYEGDAATQTKLRSLLEASAADR